MIDARKQFVVLHRDFLSRLVDLELLSAQGDLQRLLGQFGALLAAFSFTFCIGAIPKYVASSLPEGRLHASAMGEQEFLVAATMALAGLFAVLSWNNVLPDRRDSLILGVLPVRARTLFLARAAAIATALGVTVIAVNCFTGLAYPLVAMPAAGGLGVFRAFVAWWAAMLAAGLFVCCALLAVQGLASQLLTYRLYLRVSAFLQLAAFFVVLAGFFLKPPFPAPDAYSVHAFQRQPLYWWIPSFWFFGLMHQLNGSADRLRSALAARGLWALAIAASIALLTAALAYGRNMRRIVEQPDIAPSDRSHPSARLGSWLAARIIRRPVERAVVMFTSRTIARSRQHRLLIAAYGGIGLAIALLYCRELIYGASSFGLMNPRAYWSQANIPMMISSLVMLVFAVLGARAVFALPITLPANWIFRVTAVHRPSHYFRAVRNAVVLLAAGPICGAFAAVYLSCWPTLPAVEHTLVLCAAAVLLVSRSLDGFHKIPFACSYLPGKANINVKLGVYALIFLFCAEMGVQIEFWAIHSLISFAVVFALLSTAALWSYRHWQEFASSPYNQIQFEDLPVADVSPLDLHGTSGGGWTGGESAPPPPPAASFPSMARSSLLTLSTAAAAPEPIPLGTRIEQIWTDLRQGARIFIRAPGFSTATVLLLALGIGGNTAIYSMIHGLWSKPAPGVKADGLVIFGTAKDGQVSDPGLNSYPAYIEYAARTRTMKSLAAYRFARFTVSLADGSWQLRGGAVTGSYIETLGLHLAQGRDFTRDEASGKAPLAAIIAWHVWQNQFHSGSAIGSTVVVNGHPATVVGITPEGFRGLELAPHFEICLPMEAWLRETGTSASLGDPAQRGFNLIGRLNPGVSLTQAQAEFDAISRVLEERYPETNLGRSVVLAAYPTVAFGPLGGRQTRFVQGLVMAAGLGALLMICANVANLMLARVLARRKELAVRMALGAPWTRIVSTVAGEAVVISLAASAAALLTASWITRIVGGLMPPIESGARFSLDFSPDWKVALYALALAAFCTATVTVAPALRIWRKQPRPGARPGLQGALVVAQLAMCMVFAAGGITAWRAISSIDHDDVYIHRDHLLLAAVDTSGAFEPDLLERIRARLLTLPRVTSVSWALAAPPGSHSWKGIPANDAVRTQGTVVGPGYLTTLGIHLLAGRDLREHDSFNTAVINRKLAQALWPGQTAIGRTFSMPRVAADPIEVVGVAPDAPYSGVADDGSYTGMGKGDRPNFVFLADDPQSRGPGQSTFHIRYAGSPGSLAAEVRAAIHEVAPPIPVFSMRSMEEEWAAFTAPWRDFGMLVQIFGAASLLLAAIGLSAVVGCQVTNRTRELGIRAALGARPSQVFAAAVRGAALLAAMGLCAGVGLTFAGAHAAGALTFGIRPADPLVLAAVAATLMAVSMAACMAPALRAVRIDPTVALREE